MCIYRLCGWWWALSKGTGTSQVAAAIKMRISIVTMVQSVMGQDTGQQPTPPPPIPYENLTVFPTLVLVTHSFYILLPSTLETLVFHFLIFCHLLCQLLPPSFNFCHPHLDGHFIVTTGRHLSSSLLILSKLMAFFRDPATRFIPLPYQ